MHHFLSLFITFSQFFVYSSHIYTTGGFTTEILDVQSIDNGPLSNHTKFQLDWSKNGRVMAEKRMPIYGHTRVSEVNFGL